MSKKSASKDDIRQLSGAERSAIIMLSLMEGGRGGSNRTYKNEGIDAYLTIKFISQI